MTPLLRSLLSALSLACFAAPVSRADDTGSPKQLREESAALHAKLESSKSDSTGAPVVIGRKTPPDLAGLDIFGSVACNLDTPPAAVTPAQLKFLKDWRMTRLGEWNAKARVAIARGVSPADVARWKISLHWTQFDSGEHLTTLTCHVSEETDAASPLSTIHTFNFIDGAPSPVSTSGLLAGDDALPALRLLLEKHRNDAPINIAGNDNLFRLASLAKASGGTLTLKASATNEGGFTLGASALIDGKALAAENDRNAGVVVEVTPEITKDSVLTLGSRPVGAPVDLPSKTGAVVISSSAVAVEAPSGEKDAAGIAQVKNQGRAPVSLGVITLSSGQLKMAPLSASEGAINAQAIAELGTGKLRQVVLGLDTVHFCFDPGVVAPASRGVVVISVPASELKPLLSPEARALIEKR